MLFWPHHTSSPFVIIESTWMNSTHAVKIIDAVVKVEIKVKQALPIFFKQLKISLVSFSWHSSHFWLAKVDVEFVL